MIDIKGEKFNYLTAITPLYQYRRCWVWECLCNCGKTTKVSISKLKNGTTKSCGCFKAKNISPKFGDKHKGWRGYEQISKSFFNRIKQTAILRNIEFNVTIEYLWCVYQKQNGKCAYTGEIIDMPIYARNLRGENNETIASLDRIDNEKGYVEGNVQWVCKRANYMKHTMTENYFLNLIKKIYEYRCTL